MVVSRNCSGTFKTLQCWLYGKILKGSPRVTVACFRARQPEFDKTVLNPLIDMDVVYKKKTLADKVYTTE